MQSDYFLTYVYTSSKFFINLVLSLISLKTTPMLPAITLAKAVSGKPSIKSCMHWSSKGCRTGPKVAPGKFADSVIAVFNSITATTANYIALTFFAILCNLGALLQSNHQKRIT